MYPTGSTPGDSTYNTAVLAFASSKAFSRSPGCGRTYSSPSTDLTKAVMASGRRSGRRHLMIRRRAKSGTFFHSPGNCSVSGRSSSHHSRHRFAPPSTSDGNCSKASKSLRACNAAQDESEIHSAQGFSSPLPLNEASGRSRKEICSGSMGSVPEVRWSTSRVSCAAKISLCLSNSPIATAAKILYVTESTKVTARLSTSDMGAEEEEEEAAGSAGGGWCRVDC
mmetsp:Transcript_20112/g.33001  ORF Transcript_20112/g.33001 Transcript_20112/m.33001 type:complete len:224 (+) Transcript_20112:865-1536(+)